MSVLERGKFIRHCADPKTLAFFPENREAVADLFRRYRMEWILRNDRKPISIELKEWVCVGAKGNVWEYGKGLLGITVEGQKWTSAFIRFTRSFATVTQNGDRETNLRCAWTWQNAGKLASLLKLYKRKFLSEAQKRALIANLKPSKALPEALGAIRNASKGTC